MDTPDPPDTVPATAEIPAGTAHLSPEMRAAFEAAQTAMNGLWAGWGSDGPGNGRKALIVPGEGSQLSDAGRPG